MATKPKADSAKKKPASKPAAKPAGKSKKPAAEKAAPEPAEPPKPRELTKEEKAVNHELETSSELRKMQDRADDVKEEMDSLKDQYNGKKAEWAAIRTAINTYIRQRAAQFRSGNFATQMTLTSAIEQKENQEQARKSVAEVAANTQMPTVAMGDVKPAANPTTPAPDYDAFGVHKNAFAQFPIADLPGIKKVVVDALASPKLKRGADQISPITKLGQVSAFIQPWPDNPSFTRKLADLKGMGDSAVDNYTEAENAFWAEWNNPDFRITFAKKLITQDKAFAELYRPDLATAKVEPAELKSIEEKPPVSQSKDKTGPELRGGGVKGKTVSGEAKQSQKRKDASKAKPKVTDASEPRNAEPAQQPIADGADGQPAGTVGGGSGAGFWFPGSDPDAKPEGAEPPV